MNIVDALEEIQDTLEADGLTVYTEIKDGRPLTLPCVILELDVEKPTEHSSDGRIIDSLFNISVMGLVNAHSQDWTTYKTALVTHRGNILTALTKCPTVRVKPVSLGYAEILVGSQKSSSVDITAEVTFNENI